MVIVHGLKKQGGHNFPGQSTFQLFYELQSLVLDAGKMSQSRAANGYKPMKRDAHGNEDLMNEAASLVPRIECRIPGHVEPVVLGYNSLGWLFVYLGRDPMYRFDNQGRLRRAFVDGKMYRTTGTTLAVLERQSRSQIAGVKPESILSRSDLSPDDLTKFALRMRHEISQLLHQLSQGQVTRQHPPDDNGLVAEFQQGLTTVVNSPSLLAPAIVRR